MKKIYISGLILISFVLLIASIVFFIDKTRELRRLDPLELEDLSKEDIIQLVYERQVKNDTPFYYFIPIFGFFGIVVGALIFYIMEVNIEKKEKLIESNSELILKLLNPDERKVIKKIIQDKGKVQQIEISYMQDFTKVKAHRILDSLEQKGIVEKEKLGKSRIVRIKNEYLNMFSTEKDKTE